MSHQNINDNFCEYPNGYVFELKKLKTFFLLIILFKFLFPNYEQNKMTTQVKICIYYLLYNLHETSHTLKKKPEITPLFICSTDDLYTISFSYISAYKCHWTGCKKNYSRTTNRPVKFFSIYQTYTEINESLVFFYFCS